MIQKNRLLLSLIALVAVFNLFELANAQQVVSYGCSKGACWKDCGTGNLACYLRAPGLPDHGLNSNVAGCLSDVDCNPEWNCATTCVQMAV
jgi:hypothetical protein